MQFSWEIILPILLGCGIMLKWAYVYKKYIKSLKGAIKGCNLGPFDTHLNKMINFSDLCSQAFMIMAFRDLLIVAWMIIPESEINLRGIIIVLYFISLVPLWFGANYSKEASELMCKDAEAINGLIGSTNDLFKFNIKQLGPNRRAND